MQGKRRKRWIFFFFPPPRPFAVQEAHMAHGELVLNCDAKPGFTTDLGLNIPSVKFLLGGGCLAFLRWFLWFFLHLWAEVSPLHPSPVARTRLCAPRCRAQARWKSRGEKHWDAADDT